MTTNEYGEVIVDENDICDLIMQGRELDSLKNAVISPDLDLSKAIDLVDDPGVLLSWTRPHGQNQLVNEFDKKCQTNWHMPAEYRELDIAAYLLEQCQTQEQLQRVGQELMLYQDLELFDLLRYLKYLVDTLERNQVIWGVGRGSSVASYVLYLLGVHKIDSMYYDLDPTEFLRK